MENKEIKKNAAELNDEALENVSGGLLKPIIIDGPSNSWAIWCVKCGKSKTVTPEEHEALMAAGGYYCDECKAKHM